MDVVMRECEVKWTVTDGRYERVRVPMWSVGIKMRSEEQEK